jgi:hypothetical protein
MAATLSAATGAPAGKATPAGADAQPAADAHVQRQGLDREVAQGAGRGRRQIAFGVGLKLD